MSIELVIAIAGTGGGLLAAAILAALYFRATGQRDTAVLREAAATKLNADLAARLVEYQKAAADERAREEEEIRVQKQQNDAAQGEIRDLLAADPGLAGHALGGVLARGEAPGDASSGPAPAPVPGHAASADPAGSPPGAH